MLIKFACKFIKDLKEQRDKINRTYLMRITITLGIDKLRHINF